MIVNNKKKNSMNPSKKQEDKYSLIIEVFLNLMFKKNQIIIHQYYVIFKNREIF